MHESLKTTLPVPAYTFDQRGRCQDWVPLSLNDRHVPRLELHSLHFREPLIGKCIRARLGFVSSRSLRFRWQRACYNLRCISIRTAAC